ncbi:amino acid ABC transporter ATP-binding protein [Companilactobacillus sp.]|jgi:polar amino acid transport system ATP-binding protein|uniref:amino acid ABC transporter ATP-binding protein n=1 Tax=Companilactobacillus sp. TaxID=2767905 RepID=UPI0025BCCC0E|nr:amino acid ABC transporter ATP-binding protein [Companilactobacillus sp.]MCH4010062.1 amino acid ABC transporter ATP-binding protein [Companilactobacillus sp.]MCH4052262.1 amino acid ABC transporter ATP-binding protein [Companilactobacillus sp.]MCH4078004.1 amino acid ABC transporter ATP-binding protein [Companilactobacillus sp.]MCH4126580.1 amino acid ABC transporter ATP-binding protein [Companilactobacillus sp.]MCH4132165.1 amino acid ABC transporter ATP-binding protein [Companilactobacil
MLKLENITKSFNGKTILNDLNVEVQDNSILSIVGPSGAGKTTLLRCIAGLDRPDSGKFILDGKSFDPADDSDTEQIIGVVFQDFNLFPHLTVMENVTLAPTMVLKEDKKSAIDNAKSLLDELSLSDHADQYPFELSGGQKQRVAIARALAMKPKILCYDEPTSALDPSLRDAVGNVILELKKTGITQIVVTHDPAFAKNISDQILEVKPISQN